MVNENLITLFNFQELSVAHTTIRTAEEQLKIFQNTLEDAIYKAKGANGITKEEFEEYKQMEQTIYQLKRYVQEVEDNLGRNKRKLGSTLEKLIGTDE